MRDISSERVIKEWKKLDSSIKSQLQNKLKDRLNSPHVQSSRLSGFENHYKIKLRSSGYRLVYEVEDDNLIIYVIEIGKRDKNTVYDKARKRKHH